MADCGTRVTTFLPGKLVKHYGIKDALLSLGDSDRSSARAIVMHMALVYDGRAEAVDGLFDAISAIDVARQERVPFLVLWYLLTQARDMVIRSTLIPIGVECLTQMRASTTFRGHEMSAMITGIGAGVASTILSSTQSFTGPLIHRHDDMTWMRRCIAFLSNLRAAGFRSTKMPDIFHTRQRVASIEVDRVPDSFADWAVWVRLRAA